MFTAVYNALKLMTVYLYYMTIQDLVNMCSNVPLNNVANKILSACHAKHMQQLTEWPSNLPKAPNLIPLK